MPFQDLKRSIRNSKNRKIVVISLSILFLFLLQSYFSSMVLFDSVAAFPPGSPWATDSNSQARQGQSLPPGNVTTINNWGNSTINPPCPKGSQNSSQPLEPVQGNNWTLDLAIPSVLFMHHPAGQDIIHNYILFTNGTFDVTDSSGNTFGWNAIAGLPSGLSQTTFIANSTEALQNYQISVLNQTIANVTISYTQREQFCNLAGLTIAIYGNVDWGQEGLVNGTILLPFVGKPISVQGDEAWFGNKSGIELGFNWQDSSAYLPSYNPVTNSLSWSVGSNFTIDPETVGKTSAFMFGMWDHLIQYSQGYWWFFYPYYSSGGYTIDYVSSQNGSKWSTPVSITGSGFSSSCGLDFDVAFAGPEAYYVATSPNCISQSFNYGEGWANSSSGMISWTTYSEQGLTLYTSAAPPSITVDNAGTPELVIPTQSSSTSDSCPCYDQIFDLVDGYYYSMVNYQVSSAQTYEPALLGSQLLPLQKTNQLSVVMEGYTTSYQEEILLSYTLQSGAWSTSTVTMVSPNGDTLAPLSATSVKNTTFVAYEDIGTQTTTIKSVNYTYGNSGPSQITTVTSATSAHVDGTMSSDSLGNIWVSVANTTSNAITTYKSSNGGASWNYFTAISSNGSIADARSLTELPSTNSYGYTGLGWYAGSSSPYNVEFSSLPFVVPDPSLFSDPWSSPGISPYESYFQHLSDYISPGNGLLVVKQDDLSLPGRGLDLVISRVFTTPYAFGPGNSTVGYDNYTLANFGLGWQLDFPWMGANYLHLPGGESYPYNWTGNIFLNHQGVNFELVKNSGNGGYDLYTVDGTDYHFFTNQSLAKVTDSTGNNSLTFYYNNNHGEISSIVDTVGRTITFSYNTASEVASVSWSGIIWSYGYKGSNLVNVTDPLGRVTTYQYSTGINNWLLSAIIYPTGGLTTYSYGHSLVGTDDYTYYVTRDNLNTSSSALDESTQYNYTIQYGLVMNSNATIADGSGVIRQYDMYSFGSTGSAEMILDGKKSTLRSFLSSYDGLGREVLSEAFGPSDVPLYNTTYTYDNWGNVIVSKDANGHRIWYSYANTNTTNKFVNVGNASFILHFYTNNSIISQNIHDAKLGQAELQNGIGSSPVETYFDYSSSAELLHQSELYTNSSGVHWLNTTYTYDHYGNRITSTDQHGRTTYFQFSSAYQYAYLTQQSIMVGGQNISTIYQYNFTLGLVSLQSDPNRHNTRYSYDNIGRIKEIVYPAIRGIMGVKSYSYDDKNNILTITNENGNKSEEYFDGLGRLVQTQIYSGSSLYSTESWTYNYQNNVASHTTALGNTYYYSYDALGRLTNTTNPDHTSEINVYDRNLDLFGNATKPLFVAPGNTTTLTAYTANKNYSIVWISTGGVLNTCGHILRTGTLYIQKGGVLTDSCTGGAGGSGGTGTNTNGNPGGSGLTNSTTVDGYSSGQGGGGGGGGGVGEEANSIGGTGGNGGKGGGVVILYAQYINSNGSINANGYAGSNGTAGVRSGGGGGGGGGGAGGSLVVYYNEIVGNGTMTVLGGAYGFGGPGGTGGLVCSGSYYNGGAGGSPDGGAGGTGGGCSSGKGQAGQPGQRGGNGANGTLIKNFMALNAVFSYDEDNHLTEYNYDWNNQLISVSQFPQTNINYTTVYTYNGIKGQLATSTDALGQKTSYYYDDLNRLVMTKYPDGSFQNETYDQVGNVMTLLDPNGHTTKYSYDSLNRLSVLTYPDSSTVTYSYDPANNVLSETYSKGSKITFAYNERNWVNNETIVTNGHSYNVRFSYDLVGNLLYITYPDKYNVYYTYDALNRPTSVVRSNGIGSPVTIATISYTLDNQIHSLIYGNGINTTYTYDTRDRPTRILSTYGTTKYQDLNYTYDGTGNVLSIKNTQNTQSYSYDNMSRLTYTNGPWGTIYYSYDGAGNMVNTTIGGTTTTYSYSSYNRLIKTQNSTTVNYGYDSNGNMLSQSYGSTTISYKFDYENRLVSAVKNGAVLENNTYDGSGRLTASQTGSTWTGPLFLRTFFAFEAS